MKALKKKKKICQIIGNNQVLVFRKNLQQKIKMNHKIKMRAIKILKRENIIMILKMKLLLIKKVKNQIWMQYTNKQKKNKKKLIFNSKKVYQISKINYFLNGMKIMLFILRTLIP